MTKYERIRQMRLEHAAGCTEPPAKPKLKGFKIETISKIMAQVAIPAASDPFDIYLSGEMCSKHQLG